MKISISLCFICYCMLNLTLPGQSSTSACDSTIPIKFVTYEGTWMNLDISPDGSTIVFDLLGDIYTLPIQGGKATPIRTGMPWEVQPRFSPNGKWIAFTSDAGGADNIWIMDPQGKYAKSVTNENFRLLNNPSWSPDSKFLLARKHFTATRSLGAGEIWMYSIAGGEGIQLTTRKNDQQDVNEPVFSKDGTKVFYSEDVYPGGYFQYNKDPNSQIYAIQQLDLKSNKTSTVIQGPGGAIRPQPSPTGRYLAFIKRIRTKTCLFIRDMKTGKETLVQDSLSKDQQEAWAIFGPYTGFAWSPDEKHIFIGSHGKIQMVTVETGEMKAIPMEVEVNMEVCETRKTKQPRFENFFSARALRNTTVSPDGKTWVTHAAGKLYEGSPKNGFKPIDTKDFLAFEPAFSPDGRYLAYVTWDDTEGGAIWLRELNTKRNTPIKLTEENGIYRTPSFNPQSNAICYLKEGPNAHMGAAAGNNPGIYFHTIKNNQSRKVAENGEFPVFIENGNRIAFQTGGHLFGSLNKTFSSVDLSGLDPRVHVKSKYANRFLPSPDGKWLAFTELYKVYIIPFPSTGNEITISGNMKSLPVALVSENAGIALQWIKNGNCLQWTIGAEAHSICLDELFHTLNNPLDTNTSLPSPSIDTLNIVIPGNQPLNQSIAFTNARIITMGKTGVIENGTIVIEDNRIRFVGQSSQANIPSKAVVLDMNGKTILPGLVDVHAHTGNFRYGISPQQQWEYMANLAFGVTTTHDPSANTEMVFAQSEALRAGRMLGPRLFSTGTILYGADGDFKASINTLEDAILAVKRNKAFGAFSVKSYNQPRREQRQWVMRAASKENMIVVPEGGSFFYHNMNMIVDGHTGIEHNIPVAPLFSDVIQFWSKTKTGNTPTLIVNYGGINGECYWYQNANVWQDTHLLTFVPREVVDSRSRHRTMVPQEEYENGHMLVSKSCKKLWDAGVNIHLGSHGQIQGLGAHWELWMLAQGGMSPLEALEAATIRGAQYLGLDDEMGSLEPGKLADLFIVEGKPDLDIYQSRNIRWVMINGRLYQAETLNQIYPESLNRKPMFWELIGAPCLPFNSMGPSCSCGKH